MENRSSFKMNKINEITDIKASENNLTEDEQISKKKKKAKKKK